MQQGGISICTLRGLLDRHAREDGALQEHAEAGPRRAGETRASVSPEPNARRSAKRDHAPRPTAARRAGTAAQRGAAGHETRKAPLCGAFRGEGVGYYAGFCSRRASRRALDGHLSRGHVAVTLQRSTRGPDEQPHRPLSDLAPGEVYRADRITPAPGGLLHHRFTLTAGRGPWRSVLCGTVSRVTPGGCYPPPCSAEPGRSSAPGLSPRRRDRLAGPFAEPVYGPGQASVDSSPRTRMQPLSGQSTTWSGAVVRIQARSDSVRATPLPSDTLPRRSAAPTP